MQSEFNLAEALSVHAHLLQLPGSLLMKSGRQDYVGAALCLRGTLYFKGAHTLIVREALCQCLDDFRQYAEPHLKWLWREEPLDGKPLLDYSKAKPLRKLLAGLSEHHPFSVYYSSGEQSLDAPFWRFSIFAQAAWQAAMGDDLSVMEFSVPLLYQEQHPLHFLNLMHKFCHRLAPEHGHAGHAYNLSPTRRDANQPTEAFMAERMPGLDAGTAALLTTTPGFEPVSIKTVSWLTVLDHARLERAGGVSALRAQLPPSHFAFYDYGAGSIIQSGAYPYLAGDAEDPRPAPYVLLNHLLKGIRCETVGPLLGGSHDGELRLVGWAADQWLKRLDVEDAAIPAWRSKLLDREPALDASNRLSASP